MLSEQHVVAAGAGQMSEIQFRYSYAFAAGKSHFQCPRFPAARVQWKALTVIRGGFGMEWDCLDLYPRSIDY